MSQIFSLDNRLSVCAGFVRNNAKLADIGTDHAYLPVWLISQGIIREAIASDINKAPLEMGKATAKKYNVHGIQFRLGNGLDTIFPEDNITDIVVAGMGGEIISDIICSSPIAKNKDMNIILQPMTKSDILIENLYKNGFEIVRQKCAVSNNKCYTIMAVAYRGKTKDTEEIFNYLGKLDTRDENSQRFLGQHIKYLENKSRTDRHFKEIADILKKSL
ncbi:MAG: class I SAM-dependent methyltransferase [Ruminococcus sp.]